jgi:hypothetical protein
MPTNRQHRRQPQREGCRLTPAVREILSGGIDFFEELSHFEPIPRDHWGKIQGNLWGYAGKFLRSEYDPPEGLPDGRLDFLRDEWAKHKAEVLKWHIDRWRDGSRPWAWWMWESPEPCPRHEATDVGDVRWKTQALAILVRHGLLSREEQKMIHEQDAAAAALRAPGPDEDLPDEGEGR